MATIIVKEEDLNTKRVQTIGSLFLFTENLSEENAIVGDIITPDISYLLPVVPTVLDHDFVINETDSNIKITSI